jgi:hypothetical protein
MKVTASVTRHADGLEPESCVELHLVFPDGTVSKQKLIPLAVIEDYDWLSIPGCLLYPPYRKAKQSLAQGIMEQLTVVPHKNINCISNLGNCNVAGVQTYNAGSEIIMPSDTKGRPEIEHMSSSYNLDIDPNLTEDAAAAGMMELISLFPNAGRVILTQMLLYLMSAVYTAVWKFPCVIIFLYGMTGSMKTTTSAFLTQLHNRSKGIASLSRLNASIPAALKLLYEKRDCVVVLDDLFPAESKDLKRRQEETLYEITRVIADGTPPARIRGNQIEKAPPTSGAMYTAEYVIGAGSDAARFLPVEMTRPDGDKLKLFQDQPLLVSTFYRNFIQWYINNFAGIKTYLNEWHNVYRDIDLGVHGRLQETHFFLNTAYALLLQYCFELGVLAECDAEKMHESFLELLMHLIKAQQHRVDQGALSTGESADYFSQIRSLYKNDRFILAPSAALFDDTIHEGVIHSDELCLRKKRLKQHFPTACFDKIKDSLMAHGALRPGMDRAEIQLGPTNGKRFYAIPLHKLQ